MNLTKNYYTPDEVAAHFSIHPRTVYRLIERKDIRAIKIGGSLRIPLREIEKMQRRWKKP